MTTIALTPEGEAFLARVREELADLPADERDELLEDVESHLAEVAGEGEVALAARLGSAEEFAHELRHSAGLPPRTPASTSRLQAARARLEVLLRRADALRPRLDAALLWRVARGWLLAVAVALAIGKLGNSAAWSDSHTWLPHAGLSGGGAVLLLAGFVALSLWLARRAAAGKGVRFDRAASVLAVVVIGPALWHLDSPPRHESISYTTVTQRGPAGLAFDGVRVKNLFPYDKHGKPLEDIFLYLPSGHPLVIATRTSDLNRRYLVQQNGRRLYNSFPVRFYDHPGSTKIATGWLRPSVRFPKIRPAPSLVTRSP